MLLSHCGEYTCECKHLIFAANSPKMIRLARRITETSETLQMVTNACEFLVNHLRMLRILTNALANACERLTNETTTQRMRGETSCKCFAVSVLFTRLS